jgi:long-chain acyl-CoA synthetase
MAMINAATVAETLRTQARGRRVFAELEDGPLGYAELWQQIRQTAAAFDARGIADGDRLLVLTRSDRQAIVLFVTALLHGQCPVLLPFDTPEARIGAIIEKLRPAAVFADKGLLLASPSLRAAAAVAVEATRPRAGGMLGRLLGDKPAAGKDYPSLLVGVEPKDPRAPIDPERLAFIAFTSGTTAAPKGVMSTHRNLFEHLETLVRQFAYDAESRILNNMVLSHNDGLVQGPLLTLACGGTLLRPVPLDGRTIGPLLDSVYASKSTHFITVPTILAIAASRSEHDDYFTGP